MSYWEIRDALLEARRNADKAPEPPTPDVDDGDGYLYSEDLDES